jgi:hypothetical protein
MDITSLDVVLPSGEVEEHKGAIGQQIGVSGELMILYAQPGIDDKGNVIKEVYPAVVYAPGAWSKLMVQGAHNGGIRVAKLAPSAPRIH